MRGLVINRFTDSAIFVMGGSANTIEGNFLGTDVTGTAARGNLRGIFIDPGSGNTVGGTTPGLRNVISGNNGIGIFLNGSGASGNLVAGNFFGINAAGTALLGNGFEAVSIKAGASGNTIGGTTAGARNVITNQLDGIFIVDPGTTGNLVAGNFIGTDATGTVGLGNNGNGVLIQARRATPSAGRRPGPATSSRGNNQAGISILGGSATANVVAGNASAPTRPAPSPWATASSGVLVQARSGNTIGGTAAGAGNIIAFNGRAGVAIQSGNRQRDPRQLDLRQRRPGHRPRRRRRDAQRPGRRRRRRQRPPELPRPEHGDLDRRHHDRRRHAQQHAQHHLPDRVLRRHGATRPASARAGRSSARRR